MLTRPERPSPFQLLLRLSWLAVCWVLPAIVQGQSLREQFLHQAPRQWQQYCESLKFTTVEYEFRVKYERDGQPIDSVSKIKVFRNGRHAGTSGVQLTNGELTGESADICNDQYEFHVEKKRN